MADFQHDPAKQGVAGTAPLTQEDDHVEAEHDRAAARRSSLADLHRLSRAQLGPVGATTAPIAGSGTASAASNIVHGQTQAIGPAGTEAATSDQAAQTSSSCETPQHADERERKQVLVEQVHKFVSLTFRGIDKAADSAIRAIDVAEVPKTDMTKTLLGYAASALLSGSSGAAVAWILGSITTAGVTGAAAGAVKGLVGGAVSKALQADHATAAASLQDIKAAFYDTFAIQVQAAEQDFTARWPDVYAGLSLLPIDVLMRLNQARADEPPGEFIAKMRHQTFIAWTNFLARVKHGAMGPWDHWAENGSPGAIALPGAQQKPTAAGSDPTRNNIAPRQHDLLDTGQRPMQSDPFGVLEIFVWNSDPKSIHVVNQPGYRMRLDNVGPKVREEFRTAGKVRDLPVNKVVHVCSDRHNHVIVDPPTSIASVLVTADGYMRARNGDIGGDISAFTSAVQELPLTYLDV